MTAPVEIYFIMYSKSAHIQAGTIVYLMTAKNNPVDCIKVRRPAVTNLTTSSVVVVEDFVMAVAPRPDKIPRNRLVVIPFRMLRNLDPATFCKLSLKTFIP